LPCFSDIIKASFAGLSSQMMKSLYYEIVSTMGGTNFGGGYRLMESTVTYLKRVFKKKTWDDNRKILRVGVVASTSLVMSALPPGVQKFKGILESAWGENSMRSGKLALLMDLHEEENKYREQCFHRVTFDKESDIAEMKFILDWQKIYFEGIDNNRLDSELDICVSKAKTYFEDFGSGQFFN